MGIFPASMTESQRAALISRRTVRKIWAAISLTPQASYQELADMLGLPKSTVHYAVIRLCEAGYVEQTKGASRARTIIVPFIITRKARK